MTKVQRMKFTDVEKNGTLHMLSIVAHGHTDIIINFDGQPIIYTSIADIIRRYQDEVREIKE